MQLQNPSLALDGTHLAAAQPRYSMIEIVRAIAASVRRAFDAWRGMRRARATREALASLDDRMLRDLGLARDEIGSMSAEIAGQAERTRVHALLAPIGL